MSDRERLRNAFAALNAHGIAVSFNLAGTTGVRDDNMTDYRQAAADAGTDRWVGAHVGAHAHGGAFFDAFGQLRHHYHQKPVDVLYWSFPHQQPDIAVTAVKLFRDQGLTADWSGEISDCVVVRLDGAS
ncbi:hypothetical protein Ade02nite_20230 [Paractinoplanes deccanensis]|uniref:DUF6891 domain-containing protein n=1 Tax=Paractinoplanes deccanensis TaxID=113561 RepID=A0ABQ3Y052_9ACTN|nr:hypothetical protein [Actinoplanes deccanensis]GID73382.1 hypothetical protein Ade02nite_20230 [Actinoplanes deccanensis]